MLQIYRILFLVSLLTVLVLISKGEKDSRPSFDIPFLQKIIERNNASSTPAPGSGPADDGDSADDAESKAVDEQSESSSTTVAPIIITDFDTKDQLMPTPAGPEDAFLLRDPESKICLAIDFEARFTLPGQDGQNLTGKENLSSQTPFSGICDWTKEIIVITFKCPAFNFTMVVNKTSSGDSWVIKSMELQLDISEFHKEAKDSIPATIHADPQDLIIFTAPINQSLNCETDKNIPLYDESSSLVAYVLPKIAKMQAFNVPPDFGSEVSCVPSTEAPMTSHHRIYRSDTAPIAVGSTLAVLTLVVIAGYAIYRSLTNKKVDYGNIE